MRAGGFPGNPGGLAVSILKTAGARAPADQAPEAVDGAPAVERSEAAGARMVPLREGNEARRDGRRGIGAPHTTGEAGESCPRNPVEGRGRREMDPLEGKTANTPRLEPVSTLRQRIAERARHALGMAWVIFIASWTNGYATARSEAICRGAGCGRTRTSGSVGGQGQQRPWSTRPCCPWMSSKMPRLPRHRFPWQPAVTGTATPRFRLLLLRNVVVVLHADDRLREVHAGFERVAVILLRL